MEITTHKLYELFSSANFSVSTDTRKLINGSIFFALRGPNFDANKFAEEAIEKGCKFAIVDDRNLSNDETIFYSKDTLVALQNLANYHRSKFTIPVLAITGSNGKTTNKELIHAVLSKKYNALCTFGNLNNHIGVPLTLLQLRKEHEFAIIEMGANHQKEIASLCQIADPDFGMITNIGKAHLEGFGGIEGVKKGKGEMYDYIRAKKRKLFVNGDDEVLNGMAIGIEQICYGTKETNNIIGKDLSDENVKLKWKSKDDNRNWDDIETIETKIIGGYNFINCMAAICIGNYFGVEGEKIGEAISEYTPEMNRSQLIQKGSNAIVLDAYNANPTSMAIAINNFNKMKNENKWLFLGDMFELGESSETEHKRIIQLCEELKLKNVVLVGKEFSKLKSEYKSFEKTEDCFKYLKSFTINDSSILIKGSRSMKMETLLDAL